VFLRKRKKTGMLWEYFFSFSRFSLDEKGFLVYNVYKFEVYF